MATKYNGISSDLARAHSRYASVSFDLSNVVDYDVKDNTTLFRRVEVARVCMIRTTAPIYVKFNTTDDDPIEFFSNDGFNFGLLPVENIFITAAGDLIAFDVASGTVSMMVEVPFHYGPTNYLRQAFIGYENAGWLNSISASLVAGYTPVVEGGPQPIYVVENHIIKLDTISGTHTLAGYPVPVPAYPFNNSVGYWNIENFNPIWVPDGTGTYNFYDIDIPVGTFMQDFLIYGTNYQLVRLDSNDIENVPPGYLLNITVHNRAGVDFKVWANLYEYKQSII